MNRLMLWGVFFSLCLCPLQAGPSTPFALKLLCSEGAFHPKECSPVGLWVALSLLAEASEGKTQSELVQFLDPSSSLKTIENDLVGIKCLTKMELSLGLFGREGVYWYMPFVNSLRGLYGAIQVDTCPFAEPERAILSINNWVRKATKGEITEIFQRADVNEKTVAALLSVLYFSHSWATPFSKEFTTSLPFSIECVTKNVCTMRSLEPLWYASCSCGQYIEKSFARSDDGGRYVAEFFLPTNSLSIKELEQSINICRKEATKHLVQLFLPQSKGKSFSEWSRFLMGCGVNSLFTNEARLSYLSNLPLSVQKIKGGTMVSLNEEGVLVADVIAASFNTTSCLERPPFVELHFNKPFFFLIREKKKDIVVSCSYIGSFKQLQLCTDG